MTELEFVTKLEYVQPNLKLAESFKNVSTISLFETKFGLVNVSPHHLLNGIVPTIKSAVNKTEYFLNMLQSKNYLINYEVLGLYIDTKTKVLIKNRYGLCEILPSGLLSGGEGSIESAVDKNQYFINESKEKHGDKYNYDLVQYTNNYSKVKIICEKHNYTFEITPNKHLSKQGCKFCGNERNSKRLVENPIGWSAENWKNSALISDNFDSFKVYIIKCWNDNEEFYKIGKTFTTVEYRFTRKDKMPYNYKIITTISGDYKFIHELELYLKNLNKDNQYISKIKFNGMYECFTKVKNII